MIIYCAVVGGYDCEEQTKEANKNEPNKDKHVDICKRNTGHIAAVVIMTLCYLPFAIYSLYVVRKHQNYLRGGGAGLRFVAQKQNVEAGKPPAADAAQAADGADGAPAADVTPSAATPVEGVSQAQSAPQEAA